MRTPCQEAPEAWVGKDDNLRAQAAIDCLTCPVFVECKEGKFGLPGPDDHGVWAGVDLTNPARKTTLTLLADREVKECQECGGTMTRKRHSAREWAAVRFCSPKCRGLAATMQGLPTAKTCKRCGEVFARCGRSPAAWSRIQFCGVECAAASRLKSVPHPPVKVCVTCDVKFTRPRTASASQWAQRKFCSMRCAGQSRFAS